jgi:hypothetical protein
MTKEKLLAVAEEVIAWLFAGAIIFCITWIIKYIF